MAIKYLLRENPQLYEINTAAWLFELSQKLDKRVLLGNVPSEEWDKIKARGMDLVWLMGVWTRSQESRMINVRGQESHKIFDSILPECTLEDIIGSCYSISSYGPDPLIGTWDDLDQAREELHKRGMGLIVDFVPNHTGIDHHWIFEHPEYYIQVSEEDYRKDKEAFFPVTYEGKILYVAHGRDPNFPSWTDTAQLNYFNPETRSAVIRRLKDISSHCDGFRCDMAMLVLNDVMQRVWGWANQNPGYIMPGSEFWSQATENLPGTIFIAEAYWDTEWTLQQLGFDFVYDKRLYDRMRSGHPHDVYLHLTAGLDYQKKLVRFIENHDELRSITAFGRGKVGAVATLCSTLPGLKLYFQGQFEGKQIRLPIQIRQSKPDPVDSNIKSFYDKLLPIVNEDIFHKGSWKLREVLPENDTTAENLIAYTWKSGESLKLIAVNLSQHPSVGRIHLQDDISEFQNYSFTDKLGEQRFIQGGKMTVSSGLPVKLSGYQAQILEIMSVP